MRRKNMENLKFEVKGKNLIIEIDPSKDFGLTKTGKSTIVAKSDGFHQFAIKDEIYTLNLFLSKKPCPELIDNSKSLKRTLTS